MTSLINAGILLTEMASELAVKDTTIANPLPEYIRGKILSFMPKFTADESSVKADDLIKQSLAHAEERVGMRNNI